MRLESNIAINTTQEHRPEAVTPPDNPHYYQPMQSSTRCLQHRFAIVLAFLILSGKAFGAATIELTRADYVDRVQAVWAAQMCGVMLAWPHEHKVSSALWLTNFPKHYISTPVDDDWYYEMCAVRAFEKHGIDLTPAQLGDQWLENGCGSWGSSEQARLNLQKGIKAPDSGHPRYNKLWFTIGPQFSADVYGAIAPGLPNVTGRLARELGHVNGYAEGVDGAVFMAGMISLGFSEHDSKAIVRKAAQLIHPNSPYRQCLDLVIRLAEQGKDFQEICDAVEDRWHTEYPATNNAVPNGGIVAASVWFGGGDFLKTVNLAARAADFTDADCNAANAAAVVGAMRGMQGIPPHLVAQLGDRIAGTQMGGVKLTPPVDESISGLARRTAAIGEKFITANGGTISGRSMIIPGQAPATQPAELFRLADLMQFWNPDWKLERAGFGGAGGGMGGIRGITHLAGEVLATYPRDEVRGCLLSRQVKLGAASKLTFDAGSDAGRAWELNVYVDNTLLEQRIIEGSAGTQQWQSFAVDLQSFTNRDVTLRLYQRVLLPNRTAGNALWRNLKLE